MAYIFEYRREGAVVERQAWPGPDVWHDPPPNVLQLVRDGLAVRKCDFARILLDAPGDIELDSVVAHA